MRKYIYVLKISNTPFYVGSSINPALRFYQHYSDAAYNTHEFLFHHFKLTGAIGSMEILSACSQKTCTQREAEFIHKYNSMGYDLINTHYNRHYNIKKYFRNQPPLRLRNKATDSILKQRDNIKQQMKIYARNHS